MAELNFGLLTPPGSQSIGNAFVQGMDQAAVARAQENQNAMAQYTLGKAKREDAQQNELYNAVRQPGFKLDIGTAMQFGAPGLAAYKAQQDAAKSDVDIAYTKARTGAIPGATAKTLAETTKLQSEARSKDIAEVASLPDAASASAAIDLRLLNKSITQQTADLLREGLTPENFLKWKHSTLMSLSTPEQQLKQSALSHVDTPRGDYTGRQYFDAQGKAFGPEERLNIGVSPNTTATIKAARQNHLENLAQQGWTFDTERGIAVNARQGISRPISTLMAPVNGAPVTSAAPFVGGVSPTGGVPGQRQAPTGQPVADVLGPKPEKLNESQGNATAYGLRMKESEAILQDLANPKTGAATLRGANVESIPFVGGAVGKVLPSFLGGSNEQQQQVVQAKTNFITAVLRKESGAAIGQDEFTTEDRKYFPQLNDGPKVIKQKENARRLAIEAMKFQAGPGAKEIDKYVPSVNEKKESTSISEPPPGAVRRRGQN